MITTLRAILVGFLVFNTLAPGMISMDPRIADAVARTAAVRIFP